MNMNNCLKSDVLLPLRQEYLQSISPPQMRSLRHLFDSISIYLNPYALHSPESQATLRTIFEYTVGLAHKLPGQLGRSSLLQVQPPLSYRKNFTTWFIKQIETIGTNAAKLLHNVDVTSEDEDSCLSDSLEEWYNALGELGQLEQELQSEKGVEQFYRLYDLFGFYDALETLPGGQKEDDEGIGAVLPSNGSCRTDLDVRNGDNGTAYFGENLIMLPTNADDLMTQIRITEEDPESLLILPSPPIKILETQGGAFVSNGTTGLVTWEASIELAKWLIAVRKSNFIPNSGLSLSNERVKWIFELGSGCGLLAISALKTFTNLKKYIATDGSEVALNKARENFIANFHCLPDSRIHFEELDWEKDWDKFVVLVERCTNEFGRGLLVGADIVFDTKLIQPLVRLVKRFQEVQMSTAHFGTSLLSCTVRNEDTMAELRKVLEKENLENRTVHSWENGFVLECSIII